MTKVIFHADDYGRSKNISRKIRDCINRGNITGISIIVGCYKFTKNEINFLKKKCNNIRLHLNLTEKTHYSHINFKTFSYQELVLMSLLGYKSEDLVKSIENQIIYFKKIFNLNRIKIDGHQHVHLVPCVNQIIENLKYKHKICETRYIEEKIFISDLFKISKITSIFKNLLLKFFSLFLKKNIKSSSHFYGIVNTGEQNEEEIFKYLKNYKNKQNIEILFHPGSTNIKERKYFDKKFFNYYNSVNRRKEFKLCKSVNLKTKIDLYA